MQRVISHSSITSRLCAVRPCLKLDPIYETLAKAPLTRAVAVVSKVGDVLPHHVVQLPDAPGV